VGRMATAVSRIVTISELADRSTRRGAERGNGLTVKHVIGSGQDSYYGWRSAFGNRSLWFGRAYVWFDQKPRGDVRLVRALGGDRLSFSISVMRNGRLAVKNGANATIATTAGTIATRGWVRIEWRVSHQTGVVEVKFFNTPNSTVPTGTATSPSRQAIGSFTDTVQIGRSGSQAFSSTFWSDDPAVGWTSYLGPAS
jgi:hypothetical protein